MDISQLVAALKMENPEEHYYQFKNVFDIPVRRKFAIQVISKSSQYSFLLASRYSHMLSVEERHLLFDSVLDDAKVATEWFTTIVSSDEEKVLLAQAISTQPRRAAEMLANYSNIQGEVREVLMNCVLAKPIYGDKVYAKAQMSNEELDKLIKTMLDYQDSHIRLLNTHFMLGEFARQFTKEQKSYAIDKAIQFNDYNAAHLISLMNLIEEDKNRLVPLLVAKRLLESK